MKLSKRVAQLETALVDIKRALDNDTPSEICEAAMRACSLLPSEDSAVKLPNKTTVRGLNSIVAVAQAELEAGDCGMFATGRKNRLTQKSADEIASALDWMRLVIREHGR